jgi:hypothetical protein
MLPKRAEQDGTACTQVAEMLSSCLVGCGRKIAAVSFIECRQPSRQRLTPSSNLHSGVNLAVRKTYFGMWLLNELRPQAAVVPLV